MVSLNPSIGFFSAVPTQGNTEIRTFRNASAIAALQDEAQLTLNSYIHTRYHFQVRLSICHETNRAPH